MIIEYKRYLFITDEEEQREQNLSADVHTRMSRIGESTEWKI